jgi:serine/threonine protein kinase
MIDTCGRQEVNALRLEMAVDEQFGDLPELAGWTLFGELILPDNVSVPHYETSMNAVKLVMFMICKLLQVADDEMSSFWQNLDGGRDLDLVQFRCLLERFFAMILRNKHLNEDPFVKLRDLRRIPSPLSEACMWQMFSDMMEDFSELKEGFKDASQPPQISALTDGWAIIPNPGGKEFDDILGKFTEFEHPCLARINRTALPPLVVREDCCNRSLHDFLSDPVNLPLSSTEKTMLVAELVCGLWYLHSQRIVHGNLSPRQLLIDSEGHLHINGFITNTLQSNRFLEYDGRFPVPKYSPPDRHVSFPSDVYFVGIIICEIFGNPNWDEDATREAFVRAPRPRPPLPPEVNCKLCALIDRCLDPSPAERPGMEDVFEAMNLMQFYFLPDVDTKFVRHRVIELTPPPVFEPQKAVDRKVEDPPRRAEASFDGVIDVLIQKFPNIGSDGWNPAEEWKKLHAQRKITETVVDLDFCHKFVEYLLTAISGPTPVLERMQRAVLQCRKATGADQMEVAIRQLHAEICHV